MKRIEEGAFRSDIERQVGFGLLEVMIVIAIIGPLSTIAIPNILSYRENARLRGAANEMLATFRKAQTLAVKRNFNTGLVFDSAAGTTTIYVDDGKGGGTANDKLWHADEKLEVVTLPVGCSISGITFAGNQTGFPPRGLPLAFGGTVEVHSTSPSAKNAYEIILSIAGHTRIGVIPD